MVSEKIQVYVVDDNEFFIHVVEESLKAVQEFEIAGKAHDGETAIREILEMEPDIVLLDLILPQKDGIAVLEELQKAGQDRKPVVIILTSLGQEKYIKKALSLGAEYYILKPYDMKLLPRRIMQVYQDSVKEKGYKRAKSPVHSHISESNPKEEYKTCSMREKAEADIIRILREVGAPPHLNGYIYLQKAILETVFSERGFIPITKKLYPMLAESFNTSPGKVERAIRGVIRKVCERMDTQQLKKFFTCAENRKDAHLTNSEFIAAIADKIRLMYMTSK